MIKTKLDFQKSHIGYCHFRYLGKNKIKNSLVSVPVVPGALAVSTAGGQNKRLNYELPHW